MAHGSHALYRAPVRARGASEESRLLVARAAPRRAAVPPIKLRMASAAAGAARCSVAVPDHEWDFHLYMYMYMYMYIGVALLQKKHLVWSDD